LYLYISRINLKRAGKDVQHLVITDEIKNKNLQKRQSLLGVKKSTFGDTDLMKTKKKTKRSAPNEPPKPMSSSTTLNKSTTTTSTAVLSTTLIESTPTRRKNVLRPPPPKSVNYTDKDHIAMWIDGDGFASYVSTHLYIT